MSSLPPKARPCRCPHPLLDAETCLRCGREPVVTSEPALTQPARAPKITWTRPRVVRAIRAFAFFRERAPVVGDWRRRMGGDWPPLESVEALFGSVDAAVRAAGVGRPSSRAVGE
jgi:hypothetical protein